MLVITNCVGGGGKDDKYIYNNHYNYCFENELVNG